ncbi:uncharacterized protein LOC128863620 isoform X1 [Anastrepha ludens]|uniref:uncharacterized protein LOC128863620 isoform X1 n=1 Tax=Anastrepha ludens TaxID=28586 RepID=UPI0023B0902B|nr:uncharacterized protein LOC128863620 isoform X1 [Anastrepha ludens]
MAEETVRIKQEPLETIYAAEIDEFDADTFTTSSGRSTDSSAVEDGKRAFVISNIRDTAELPVNVKIKVEPDIYTYSEENDNGVVDCSAQMILGEDDVQVKAEPEDDVFSASNYSGMSESLSQPTKYIQYGQELPPTIVNDFHFVHEDKDIITISASELSPQNEKLAFKQSLETVTKQNQSFVRKPRNFIICNLCMKRCFQDVHYTHHMEQHKKNRIFCLRKTCDTWFNSLEDCESHEYEVHDIHELKCNVCNHKFQSFEQLRLHKTKMHSKLQRFVCSLCHDWFISMAEMHEHWASLPYACGRLSIVQTKTPMEILELLKEKTQKKTLNSYKIKSASNAVPPGLKLKPTLPNNNAQQNSKKPATAIEIKQEPIDYETILPDFPVKVNNTTSVDNYEVVKKNRPPLGKTGLFPPHLKLRLRKLPLSTTPSTESKEAALETQQQVKSDTLGHLLAERITSKFSLKSVPKMFHLANKANETKDQSNAPTTFAQSLLKNNLNTTHAVTVSTQNEPPKKILKLPSNFKIVRMLPTAQPVPVQMVNSGTPINALANSTHSNAANTLLGQPGNTAIQQNGVSSRQFALKEVEVPSLDKTVAAAKLESVTKNNTELSLTELLNEVIVRESSITDDEVEKQERVEIKVEQIKTELDEDLVEQQYDDSLGAGNFSDNSMGSSSNATIQNTIFEDSSAEFSRTPRSPQITRSKSKRVPDGYICPKCGRRYTTHSMIAKHLRNNCGRNPQHQCDVCHKCFFSTSTLNCHRTIHTGVLPHKCNYCDKRFRTRGQVTVHHRTHTGERPFVCEICSQCFTHRETLISHLSRHIGMKRYKCYGCNKQFSCISGLSMHRATRPDTCGQYELNTRAVGPRVRVIRGRVVFEPQPTDVIDGGVDDGSGMNNGGNSPITEVLTEIQNK